MKNLKQMKSLDKIDFQILSILIANNDMTYREMADKLDISQTTIYNRIKKLKKETILKESRANINFGNLGFELAIILLSADPQKIKEVAESLAEFPEVFSVGITIGSYDVYGVAYIQTIMGYNQIHKKLRKIRGVKDIKFLACIEIIKKDEYLGILDAWRTLTL